LTGQSIPCARRRVADAAAIGNNRRVQSVFPIVVFGAVVFSVVMSIVFLLTRSTGLHDEIGEGGLTIGHEAPAGTFTGHLSAAASQHEAEVEIRQMLSARRERQLSRGEPGLDVDAEVARLLADAPAPAHDPGLEEEVRQLVVARNERRARQGLEPLEVDAEVARTLAELQA
jgi:hypothetical protein